MSTDETRIAEFWSWFARHAHELAAVGSDTDPILEALGDAIQRIGSGLRFEICVGSQPREVIVTAQGRRELFPLAAAVAAAAPPLEDWTCIALKPALGFGFRTTYEGVTFDPGRMWFAPLRSPADPSALGLCIGVPDLEPARRRSAENAILVLLDTALGERAAATDIGHVEVVALPTEPAEEGYIELTKLCEYIAWRKAKLGEQGRSPSPPPAP